MAFELKDIFVVFMILAICLTGAYAFMDGLYQEYDVQVNEGYTSTYSNVTSQTDIVRLKAGNFTERLEKFDTATGLNKITEGALLTVDSLNLIVTLPLTIFTAGFTILSSVSNALNLPTWLVGFIIASIIFAIGYKIIGSLLRKDL